MVHFDRMLIDIYMSVNKMNNWDGLNNKGKCSQKINLFVIHLLSNCSVVPFTIYVCGTKLHCSKVNWLKNFRSN